MRRFTDGIAVMVPVALLLALAGCQERHAQAQAAPPAAERRALPPVSTATVGVQEGRVAATWLPAPWRPAAGDAAGRALSPLEEQWGVEILGVMRTSGGYMLDFRYRVLDPVKAAPILDRGKRSTLLDEATGAVSFVPTSPTVGPLRQTSLKPEAGRIYFQFFTNPAAEIEVGDLVTVEIGDFRAEHVPVR
ncbi:MAG: hypothetical protein HY907_14290 [Deltaproteobacteria bacterium]|nr:hypothetical protein [Deltaproteobacteria bacterium]